MGTGDTNTLTKDASRTFWSRFGYGVRTVGRVEQVRNILAQRSIVISVDGTLGKEERDDWVTLSFDPGIMPSAEWFQTLEQNVYDSEKEVEFYFVEPVFRSLGYTPTDFAFGYRVLMSVGSKTVNGQVDLAIFDGDDWSSALIVVEAKAAGGALKPHHVSQAKSYALWLHPVYYVLMNGPDTRVMLMRSANQPDVPVMSVATSKLRQRWMELFQTLNRTAVVRRKAMMR